MNFRQFLERHRFGQRRFDTIQGHLASHGLTLQEGRIVDASIISAPSSTNNKEGRRDPEMHPVKKGHEWPFGMKMHGAVDDAFGRIHRISTTPGNVHDITQAGDLLHGKEKRVWGDAGYGGIEKRDEHKERAVDGLIAMRPAKRAQRPRSATEAQTEKLNARTRAKVEPVFSVIKQRFGDSKVRYRGLEKNTHRLYVLSGLTNVLRAEKYLPV